MTDLNRVQDEEGGDQTLVAGEAATAVATQSIEVAGCELVDGEVTGDNLPRSITPSRRCGSF